MMNEHDHGDNNDAGVKANRRMKNNVGMVIQRNDAGRRQAKHVKNCYPS